jgi:hypothetical protein
MRKKTIKKRRKEIVFNNVKFEFELYNQSSLWQRRAVPRLIQNPGYLRWLALAPGGPLAPI